MKLTAKCLEAFNDYYHREYMYYSDHNRVIRELSKLDFWGLPPAFRIGVLVEFFDTIPKPNSTMSLGQYIIHEVWFYAEYGCANVGSEAFDKAIEKANEIFNLKQ